MPGGIVDRQRMAIQAEVIAGGHVFHAEVAAVKLAGAESEVRFNLLAELVADPALPVTLVTAIYKFDHMEWAIEKATELGVAGIAPVIAQRTEKHLAQAAAKRAERWRRIVLESAKQARRSDVPIIYDAVALAARVSAESGATLWTRRFERQAMSSRCLRLQLGPKVDGRRTKKRCLTRMDGRLCRWGHGYCARRLRRLPRWRWWRLVWSSSGTR